MSNGSRFVLMAGLLLMLWGQLPTANAQEAVDLPACEAIAPGRDTGLSIGIVQPHASEHLVAYAARLTLVDPTLNVCAESWRQVLPRWVPWSSELERGMGFGVFSLAFVVAVTLLWLTTPRQWWRRTTLLGLIGVGALTWAIGVAALAALEALGAQRLLYDTVVSLRLPRQAGAEWLDLKGSRDLEALLAGLDVLPTPERSVDSSRSSGSGEPTATTGAPVPSTATAGILPLRAAGQPPSGTYRVAHRLNLRSGPGIQSEWQATLPRGEMVQFDGEVQGDWWRIKRADGASGWCSSLWLRRPQEGLPPAEAVVAPRS